MRMLKGGNLYRSRKVSMLETGLQAASSTEAEAATKDVHKKRSSENMQQIYSRIPMPNCNSIKLQSNFIENTLRHGCCPVNLLHIFRTHFPRNTLVWLFLSQCISFWRAERPQKNPVPFILAGSARCAPPKIKSQIRRCIFKEKLLLFLQVFSKSFAVEK